MKPSNILNALGIILIAFGVIMLSPIAVAIMEQEYSSILPFVIASLSSVTLGLFLQKQGGFSRNFDNIRLFRLSPPPVFLQPILLCGALPPRPFCLRSCWWEDAPVPPVAALR